MRVWVVWVVWWFGGRDETTERQDRPAGRRSDRDPEKHTKQSIAKILRSVVEEKDTVAVLEQATADHPNKYDHPFPAMAKNALLGVLESTVGKYVQGLDGK